MWNVFGEHARSREGSQLISRWYSDAPEREKDAVIEVTQSRNGDSALATEPVESPATLFGGWLVAWIVGSIAATAALLLSLFRVRRSQPMPRSSTTPSGGAAANTLGRQLSLRRPARLVVSDAIETPMAGGLLRPVYLPRSGA
jgi:beta-lactamase regulating signal transducer with metallopeptidase domain